jgi:hypothetical protein
MKKIVVALLFLGKLANTHGQGTLNFSNQSSALSSPPDRLIRFDPATVGTNSPNPFRTNEAPLVGTNFVAQLFYGASTSPENSLVAVSTAPATFRASTSPNAGTWAPGTRTVTGFTTGDTVHLQVRVWDRTYASSWDEYLIVRQGLAGVSSMFSFTFCVAACPPGTEDMQNFVGFSVGIPEPSIGLVFVLGIALLFKSRRSVEV